VARFLEKVRGIIKRNKTSSQRVLIGKLNPVIRGWVILFPSKPIDKKRRKWYNKRGDEKWGKGIR